MTAVYACSAMAMGVAIEEVQTEEGTEVPETDGHLLEGVKSGRIPTQVSIFSASGCSSLRPAASSLSNAALQLLKA